MDIERVELRAILDSRNEETLEAEFTAGGLAVSASVPNGKSRGTHEVFVRNPREALVKFETIKPKILSQSFGSQDDFDNFIIGLDGTPNKNNLGGNLTLVLSLAFARLKARNDGLELFQYIRRIFETDLKGEIQGGFEKWPRPILNVINGGSHAQNNLSFQEFQIIPETQTYAEALQISKEFYQRLGEKLNELYGVTSVSLGDEAGYSAPIEDNEKALDILAETIARNNYPLRIGLDAAASQYFKDNLYFVGRKQYSPDEIQNFYLEIIPRYNILSLEDPFSEDSFEDFAQLSKKFPFVITDDLTTTNPERLKKAIAAQSGSAIIVKPNQIGTLTEALNVARLASRAGWKNIVSHRSGETADDFIADLAWGINAWGIKAGAPAQPERLSKYERLLNISLLTKQG